MSFIKGHLYAYVELFDPFIIMVAAVAVYLLGGRDVLSQQTSNINCQHTDDRLTGLGSN